MYLVKSAFRDWSRRFFGFSQGAFRPVPLFSLWARASASMRCSRTSIRSWIAMGGLAVSCSTSCCCGTDTVPWPSNTMQVGHTRVAWSHGRRTASRTRSAPSSSTAWNRRSALSSIWSRGCAGIDREDPALHMPAYSMVFAA